MKSIRSSRIEVSKSPKYIRTRDILYKIEDKLELRKGDKDFDFLVNEVFINHPNWVEKKGCGVDYIVSHKPTHIIFNRYPCFHLVRKDGSKVDISYTNCFFSKSISINRDEDNLKSACRKSIEKYIEDIKMNIRYPFKCPVLGIICYDYKSTEAHHQELTFDDIFYEWIKGKDIDYLYSKIDNSGYGSDFNDLAIKEDFYSFHKKMEKILVVSTKAHKFLHKNNLQRKPINEIVSNSTKKIKK